MNDEIEQETRASLIKPVFLFVTNSTTRRHHYSCFVFSSQAFRAIKCFLGKLEKVSENPELAAEAGSRFVFHEFSNLNSLSSAINVSRVETKMTEIIAFWDVDEIIIESLFSLLNLFFVIESLFYLLNLCSLYWIFVFIIESLFSSLNLCFHHWIFVFIIESFFHHWIFVFIIESLFSSLNLCFHHWIFVFIIESFFHFFIYVFNYFIESAVERDVHIGGAASASSAGWTGWAVSGMSSLTSKIYRGKPRGQAKTPADSSAPVKGLPGWIHINCSTFMI